MHKARGPDRRKWNSRRGWGMKLPEGFLERRRQVERRLPAVAEASLDEFEELKQSVARRRKKKREAAGLQFDSPGAPAPAIAPPVPLQLDPDENG